MVLSKVVVADTLFRWWCRWLRWPPHLIANIIFINGDNFWENFWRNLSAVVCFFGATWKVIFFFKRPALLYNLKQNYKRQAEYNQTQLNCQKCLFCSNVFVLFYILFVLCPSVYCLCVNVYCTAATGWLPNCSLTNISISCHISLMILLKCISYIVSFNMFRL